MSNQPRRVGRPAGRPDEDAVPEYFELACWLIDQLEVDPPITRTQIAATILTEGGRPVAVSTVSGWLKGRKNIDPRLVEAVLAARSEHLGPGHRILLARHAADLTEAAKLAEQSLRRQPAQRRPAMPTGGPEIRRQVTAVHDECRRNLRTEERRRFTAEAKNRNAEEAIDALSAQIDTLIEQQAREREQLQSQVFDQGRHIDQVRILQLENAELKAALQQTRGLEPDGRQVVTTEPLADRTEEREALVDASRLLEERRDQVHREVAEAERRRNTTYNEITNMKARGQTALAELDEQRRSAQAEIESLQARHQALLGEVEHLAAMLRDTELASPALPEPTAEVDPAGVPNQGEYYEGAGYGSSYPGYGRDYYGRDYYGSGYGYGNGSTDESGYYAQPLPYPAEAYPDEALASYGSDYESAQYEPQLPTQSLPPGRHRRAEP